MFRTKTLFRGIGLLSLLIALACTQLQAQFYHAPSSLSSHRGYDIYVPPLGCKEIKVYRQVPGARFPNGIDLLLERGTYDEAGRLLVWERFQSIMGDLVMRLEFKYSPEGLPLEEKAIVKGEVVQFQKSYVWETGGTAKKAKVKLADGKVVGECQVLPDGNIEFSDYISGPERRLITTTDKHFRVLSVENQAANVVERYICDPDGMLRKVEFSGEGAGGAQTVQFIDQKNAKGLVTMQTEQGKGPAKKVYFTYDKADQLFGKGPAIAQFSELRHYRWDGLLSDIIFFSTEGYSKEMVWLSYTF